mmetsp:Transcript_2771/g.3827  ORF Transcript_2771/g.3827 Transcript_2771/m.3827 type:complete len:211 (+) Transcript_2771:104-736(+)
MVTSLGLMSWLLTWSVCGGSLMLYTSHTDEGVEVASAAAVARDPSTAEEMACLEVSSLTEKSLAILYTTSCPPSCRHSSSARSRRDSESGPPTFNRRVLLAIAGGGGLLEGLVLVRLSSPANSLLREQNLVSSVSHTSSTSCSHTKERRSSVFSPMNCRPTKAPCRNCRNLPGPPIVSNTSEGPTMLLSRITKPQGNASTALSNCSLLAP